MPTITGIPFVGLSVRDARASAAWYSEILGLTIARQVAGGDWHAGAAMLTDPVSGLTLGLSVHRANSGEPFDAARTGLDHLEFGARDYAELEAWVEHLDRLGVEHSGIKKRTSAFILTFRDPDNIQLELYVPKVAEPPSAATSPGCSEYGSVC